MRMLFIHCDYFSYLTTKRTGVAEDLEEGCKSCAFKNALVIFMTSERGDEKDLGDVVSRSAEEIIDVSRKVGVKTLILFPFVHLSDDISDAQVASKAISAIDERLRERGFQVDKAPFGWEKVFSLTSKGHPLGELSRTVRL